MNDKGYRDPERYRLHAEVCRVLTDPKRLMLLDVLREGEHSVGDLSEPHRWLSLPERSSGG